ncbi:MAG: hypothetical protein AAGJ93_06595 [Bacteroidota bacterium]
MDKPTFTTLLLLLVLSFYAGLNAQEAEEPPKYTYKPIKLNMSEDGSAFIRFLTWQQYWATSDLREGADSGLKPSIRRSRFAFLTKFNPKFLLFMQWGLNSLGTNNLDGLGNGSSAPQMFLHDAWIEYNFSKEFQVGYGLHYWQGLSRASNQSTINKMALDATRPVIHWHDIAQTNQFARKLGIYAKGTLGEKFNYRLALSSPRGGGGMTDLPSDSTGVAKFGAWTLPDGGNSIFEGYLSYSFWDKEGNALPFYVGTYLGNKKILNVGAGFYNFGNSSVASNKDGSIEYFNTTHLAADVFMEYPFGNKGENGMLSTYLAYYNFDFGPDADNTATVRAATGSVIFGEVGYLLPGKKIMPYVSFQSRNYDSAGSGSTLNTGLAYFASGHNLKLNAEYHNITQNDVVNQEQFRIQLHFFM